MGAGSSNRKKVSLRTRSKKRSRLSLKEGSEAGANPTALEQHEHLYRSSRTTTDKHSDESLADTNAGLLDSPEDPVAEHRRHLTELRQQDPEFYAFLQSHDDSLLHFAEGSMALAEAPEANSSMSSTHEDDGELSSSAPSEVSLEDSRRGSDIETGSVSNVERAVKEKPKTLLHIDVSWFRRIQRDLKRSSKRMAALRRLVSVFSRLVRDREPLARGGEPQAASLADSSGHRVLLYIVVTVPSVLRRDLAAKLHDLNPEDRDWQRYRRVLLSYANTFSMLLSVVRDPFTKCFLLRRIDSLAPFLALLPKWTKALIRDLAARWLDVDELVIIRSQVHSTLKTLVRSAGDQVPDMILRECYRSFIHQFKSRNPRVSPAIDFCLQSARELFAENVEASYRVGFAELLELGVLLRKSLQTGHGCDSDAILNWSFMHSLEWWSHVLAVHPGLTSLRFPYTQIILILIDGLRSLRLFGARFACIRALLRLARETRLYLPLVPSLLEMLDFADLQRKPSEHAERKNAAIDWQRLLRIQEETLRTAAFREAVIDEVLYLLLEWLALYARDAAFPELAFPVQRQLLRYQRSSKSSFLRERIAALIGRLKEDIQAISHWRTGAGQGLASAPSQFVSRLEQRLVAEQEKRARLRPTGIVIPSKEHKATAARREDISNNFVEDWHVPDQYLEQTDDVLVALDLDDDVDETENTEC
ncbi:hypothetical protein CCYA_CCYA04G1310 [Cyanidiococcus yangmingshanensis]|nr:hypothetical protein CCYA_CCYA04G1310 [Cyanidiococcus yangmingshanensis]